MHGNISQKIVNTNQVIGFKKGEVWCRAASSFSFQFIFNNFFIKSIDKLFNLHN